MLAEKTDQSIAGNVVATGVSEADYMALYAANFHEWVEGAVIKMSPVTFNHAEMTNYLYILLRVFFQLHPIGRVVTAPYVMKASPDARRREPDLQIILNSNTGEITPTAMLGAADICIEVVSEGSEEIDYGTKFVEYQNAGVQEYWLFDPLRREYRFFRLNEDKLYISQPLNVHGQYETPLLPGLKVHVATLWQSPLPDPIATVVAVQTMLGSS
jgi:Uma2 family endonuclease